MSYELRAFIARAGAFAATQALSPCITVAPLNQGFELLYNDDLFDGVLEKGVATDRYLTDASLSGFFLMDASVAWAKMLSRKQPMAYVQADFFGGVGHQTAVVWSDGDIVLLPITNGIFNYDYKERGFKWSEAPINSALRFLGVQKETAQDEFESVGLNQGRDRDNWFKKFNQSLHKSDCKSIYDDA